jgi:hypothetical protein
MGAKEDLYAILGVSPDSEDIVIKAAYRALMRRYHPDTNNDADALARAREINAAYAVLEDQQKRAAYDASRKASRTRSQAGDNPKKEESASAKPKEPSQPPPKTPPAEQSTPQTGRGWAAVTAYAVVLLFAGSMFALAMANSGSSTGTTTGAASDGEIPVISTPLASEANATMGVDENMMTALVPSDLSVQPQTQIVYRTIEGSAKRFADVMMKDGVAGARTYSQKCQEELRKSPSWDAADRCAAFDYSAAYIDNLITKEARWTRNGYFKFQQDNMDDLYEAVGAPSYSVVLRVRKVREAAEPAAIEAFQTALNLANAKEEAAAARRDAPATPETAQPDMNYVDQSGENRSD